MMTEEQMVALLRRAVSLPHNKASDVFMTCAVMAEAIEGVAEANPKTGKGERDREDKPPVLTVKKLRDLGLEYATVAECAHDLVTVKGMTQEAAAKRMGGTIRQVRAGLLNYKLHRDKKKGESK